MIPSPETIIINCPPCFVCGKRGEVTVAKADFERYQGGALIQQAFPELPVDQREMLISGTHPACWDELFGGDE